MREENQDLQNGVASLERECETLNDTIDEHIQNQKELQKTIRDKDGEIE